MKKSLSQLLILVITFGAPHAMAKGKPSKQPSEKLSAKAAPAISGPGNPALNRKFAGVMEQFRKGELQKKSMWDALRTYETNKGELSGENQLALLQVKAQLLFMAGYPILASEHAAKALALSPEPFAEKHQALWRILWTVVKVKPLHLIMDELASKLALQEGQPPEFGSNWFHAVGNAMAKEGKPELAKAAYEKVVMQDRYFLSSQYQLALLAIHANKPKEAEAYLQTMLNPTAQDLADLRKSEVAEMVNYARMAIGRLAYQEGHFIEAAQSYRMVRRSSNLFYDALFEQSWALFMGGSMKHALGTLYSVNSPYFKDSFNPEAKVLESIIYYWMCRYTEARNSLAEFSEQHAQAIDSLSVFLDRQRLSPETAYQLFENLISGVSGNAIGIPLNVLQTAAESDAMMLVRDQYASLVEEMASLNTYGIYGNTAEVGPYRSMLLARSDLIRNELGRLFLSELRSLKDHFEELYSQSQFLYLELLMSQKEQILGRELHADSKAAKVTDKDAFNGWSRKTQSWQDSKYEYWWDEIGYQIIDVDPECKM